MKISEENIHTPILLIGFNRPEITRQTFKYIRAAKPQKLYVAIDGPREGKEDEDEKVNQVKKIVENVDWPCKTHYMYNETNKGAEITVSSAISWVFESEEYAIILEDDIVAPKSFFCFAQEMLQKYQNNKKVWAVTGINFFENKFTQGNDYFFAKYGNTWGWATWRRVWEKFDLNTSVKDEHLQTSFLKKITNSKRELLHYKQKFNRIKKRGVGNSSWDNIACYMHRTNNLLYVIPRVNLVKNIGVEGLHTNGETKYHNRSVDEEFIARKHPDSIECNTDYDKFYFNNYIEKNLSLKAKIAQKIKSVL